MAFAACFNSVWMWQCRPEAIRYVKAAGRVEETQSTRLLEILRYNAETEYGRKFRFSDIRSPRQYREQVPICHYQSLAPWIDRVAAGRPGVLTRDAVLLLEPTSGTSGGEKLIPYTRSLRREFQRAVSAWIWDTLSSRPRLRQGTSYWSVSPAIASNRATAGGIPIGFEEDSQYLSLPQRLAVAHTLAVRPSVARMNNVDNFRYATLFQLLCAANLSMISVWSPTFLTVLLDQLEDWWPLLCRDISSGSMRLPVKDNHDEGLGLLIPRRADPSRAADLRAVFESSSTSSETFSRVWPDLGLISCWTDAAARRFVPELQSRFPQVEIQPKGLLATEGVVSIPRTSVHRSALAIRSHFYEFEEVNVGEGRTDGTGRIFLAHELEVGRHYRVIVTTGGGLYRYDLDDVIRVQGFWKQCPLIEFVGRATSGCDLVGEKLRESHVRHVLQRAFGEMGIDPAFFLLAPSIETPPRYVLYIQGRGIEPGTGIEPGRGLESSLSRLVQRGLEENPYYQHAIQMRQLAEVRTVVLDPDRESGTRIYERACTERGQKVGDIKPLALHSGTHWTEAFSGIS